MLRSFASSSLLLGFALTAAADDKPAAKPKSFTIGKETTYVDGPLDKDGYIDYAAALNERMGKGVTPENNAKVLIWKAFGPRPEGGKGMPAEYFKYLKIDEPPEQGEYFIDIGKYAQEHLKIELRTEAMERLYDQQSRAMKRAWTAKDYPEIAAWLKANDKPLAVAIEATKRSHYFMPLVPTKTEKGSSGLISALLPSVQKCRSLASALTARAMLDAGEGRTDDAWRDLIACHRLGRLIGRGGTLIESLVGIAIDQIVSFAEIAFLAESKLDAKQLRACLRDLQQLPATAPVADKMDLCERFVYLELVMMVDRHGLPYLEAMAGPGQFKEATPLQKAVMRNVNWDPALRIGNHWYDRMVAAGRVADRAEREKQFDQIESELKKLKENIQDGNEFGKAVGAAGTPEAKGKAIGEIMISLLLPAVGKVTQSFDRIEQVQRNQHVAFALAIYQREHGEYPKSLDALAPKYLAKVPSDLFSGKPLIYKPAKDGYLFYSVGVNGKDDEGRWVDDDPRGDDPGVRMPLPPLKGK